MTQAGVPKDRDRRPQSGRGRGRLGAGLRQDPPRIGMNCFIYRYKIGNFRDKMVNTHGLLDLHKTFGVNAGGTLWLKPTEIKSDLNKVSRIS